MQKIILLLIIPMSIFGQRSMQTIRGSVVDKETQAPLMGVNVSVNVNQQFISGNQTDENGRFSIENIPTGRVDVSATYIGYQRAQLISIPVTSAKEVVLKIEMESSVQEIKEVQISSGRKKGETINEMAQNSARIFSVDETQRYAGSRADVARMASNFAGVSGSDDSRNDIVIRGNSPFGVQWRLENIHIPNPNHFSVAGTTGGPVNMLSHRVLANSDFLTGAFPAEYGNALAGVFDIKMKKGNDEKHEGTFQFGIMGAELFAEGPLSKKSKSSYIVNYRYSTLELLVKMGIDIGTKQIPKYQDLNFKLNFPLKKGAVLSVFGIGGYSDVKLQTINDKRPPEREIYSTKDIDEHLKTGVGIIGISYTRPLNEKSFSKISIAASTAYMRNDFLKIKRHVDANGYYVLDSTYPKMRFQFVESKFSANFFQNHKINARHTIKFGMNTEILLFQYMDSVLNEKTWQWNNRLNTNEAHWLFQPFVQWKWSISPSLTFIAGLHGQWFTLNNSWSIEPRASLKYQIKKNQSIAFSTGLHSQPQPYYVYFQKDNYLDPYHQETRNRQLGFTRAFHFVASYDIFLLADLRMKIEAYYQHLWALPIEVKSSSYSILNEGSSFDRFFPGQLVNKGQARNVGVELTLEKFFTHNWFLMFTASGYDARYKASDGKWYNSDYNGNYMANLLGTKEFKFGKKRLHTIGVGGKITFGGGKRYTPFDTITTGFYDDPIVINDLRNTKQFKPYFRFDMKLSYSINGKKKLTHEIGIDLVNLTFQKNILRLQYIDATTPPKEVYQLGFLPLFYYRIDFSLSKNK